VGVIPNHRGKRLTSKMYDFILPILRINQVDKMKLEVLVQNISASKIYESIGFQTIRTFNCFGGQLKKIESKKIDDAYELTTLENLDWNELQSFWDYPPAWANSIAAMNRLGNQKLSIGISKNNKVIAYLIYNPKIKRIHQIAVDKQYRNQGLGTHLLNHLYKIEKSSISMINMDSRIDDFRKFFIKRGLQNTINQYEMELKQL